MNVIEHVPCVVVQVAVLGAEALELRCPPSEIKLITVPSGTVSPRRSEAIIVNAEVVPVKSQPSTLWVERASEKKFWVGNPVVIVNTLDRLVRDVPSIVATTHTGVGTVPDVSEVVTYPLESDVAEEGVHTIPPGALEGIKVKSTSTPAFPLLLVSTTWNSTTELCTKVEALADEVPRTAGVADINCILLVAGMATVIVALAVSPVTDAVITSVALPQPLSL